MLRVAAPKQLRFISLKHRSASKAKMFICLFVCLFEPHEYFFSYQTAVTLTGDRTANLDLCLALTAFSSEGSFTCQTYCDT
jgi:hypothetical protein